MESISTIVIAYNEERNIERCLKSVVPFSDEIIVVDSGSTDRTVEISQRYATRVITREWMGYGRQKRFAMEQATRPWVFSIDADEEVSPGLLEEIESLDFTRDGYEMPRKAWYLNRWIEHGGWYPGYILRLFNREKGSFTDDLVHECVGVTGSVGRLKHDLYHYTYRDVSHHVQKMNEFTTLAARQMFEAGRRAGVHNMVLFPFLEFIKVYVVKRGFMDGLAGFAISSLHSYYVFLKYTKLYEMRLARRRENGTGER